MLLGGVLLSYQLLSTPGPASNTLLPGGPTHYFDLHFMGKSILKLPVSAGALAAVLRSKRFSSPCLPWRAGRSCFSWTLRRAGVFRNSSASAWTAKKTTTLLAQKKTHLG